MARAVWTARRGPSSIAPTPKTATSPTGVRSSIRAPKLVAFWISRSSTPASWKDAVPSDASTCTPRTVTRRCSQQMLGTATEGSGTGGLTVAAGHASPGASSTVASRRLSPCFAIR
jgi:hypothetical protein